MMMTYSMFVLIVVFIHQSKIVYSNLTIAWTQVEVSARLEPPPPLPPLPTPRSVPSSSALRPRTAYFDTPTTRPRTSNKIISIPVLIVAYKLNDSDCYCWYNRLENLLLCTPQSYSTSMNLVLLSSTFPLINVTLNNCTFQSHRLILPLLNQQTIDELRLININNGNYLVFDSLSFSSYNIAHIYINFSKSQQITMLLISNNTFPSSSLISQSLCSIDIDTCYIVTSFNPFRSLVVLESISLIDIDHFSWYNFRQQIAQLPRLRTVNIQMINLTNAALANALQCEDIPSMWILTYRQIQSCSCAFSLFHQPIDYRYNSVSQLYRCSRVEYPIDLIANLCQFNGTIYDVTNRLNTFFCNQCHTISCPNGTLCTEITGFSPLCMPLSRVDYDYIRSRLPNTPLTQEFIRSESQNFLAVNPNYTLEAVSFNSIASILINSSMNHVEISPADAQTFHQTFSLMLQRPWAPSVFMATQSPTALLQQLFRSLDDTVLNIDDSDPIFEFQSAPLSSVSLRFPTDNQPRNSYGWQVSNDNTITNNITATQAVASNMTSRVFLKMPGQQQQTPCNPSKGNCSNRYGVISIKSPKLFSTTDRLPEYDVISVVAPSRQQQVTFCFNQKLPPQNTSDYITTTTSTQATNTTNSFYDQLDRMNIEGTCMYLNTTSMSWQSDGCTVDRKASNSTSVTCTCEHLTMFTVFFSSSCTVPSKFLDILSWLGCCLSLAGLFVTLIMFIVISQCRRTNDSHTGGSSSESSSSQELRRRLMSKPRRLSMVKSMLFVLCILLIIMNVLILVLTFVKPGRNHGCTILASLLYYFTLATFIWKFLFALQQSIFITSLLQQRWSDGILFIIYSILTISLPLCPVLIMNFTFQNSTFISSTCDYCWLTREFIIYALMIPILTITCLNFILYSYTMIRLCLKNRQQPGLRSTKTDYARRMQNLKIGLFFAIVMGLGWILGFLLFIPNSIVQLIGNILFCIVNTMQGFAFSIMVFCMLERASFRKCCCFWRYKKQLSSTGAAQATGSSPIAPQPSIPTLPILNDNLTKMQPLHSSSTNTTTSDHYHTSKLPSEREEEEDEEHAYSAPVF